MAPKGDASEGLPAARSHPTARPTGAPRVRAVIQARMLSRRLRGKTLAAVAGVPLVSRVIERVRAVAGLDDLLVATSDHRSDDPVAAYAESLGVRCVRGPLRDVLYRFVQASADLDDDDVVLRFTADNPVYDAERTAALIALHLEEGGDYTGVENLSPLVPEAVRVGALREAGREAEDDYDREHVTPFILTHPERFAVRVLPGTAWAMRPEYGPLLTLDTARDRERLERAIEAVERHTPAAGAEAYYAWLDAHPVAEATPAASSGETVPEGYLPEGYLPEEHVPGGGAGSPVAPVWVDGIRRALGPGHPTWVVAEIGQNHNGDLETARQLIDMAARCGAHAVKFQKRDIRHDLTEALYHRPYVHRNSYGPTYGSHREALEFDEAQHRVLRDYAHGRGLAWFCTACDAPSVDLLERLGNPLYKVASRDITNGPLLERLAATGKPIVLSTGMAGLEEVAWALETIGRGDVIVLQCVSQYPTELHRVNLRAMETMANAFGVPVGLSDHTSGIITAVAAAVMGACLVEKHVTLSRAMRGTDHAGALEEEGLRRVVKYIAEVELALGDGRKALDEAALEARSKLARSLTSRRELRAGTVLREADVVLKSPGTGVPWTERERLIGRMLAVDVPADVTLLPTHVQSAA